MELGERRTIELGKKEWEKVQQVENMLRRHASFLFATYQHDLERIKVCLSFVGKSVTNNFNEIWEL